MFFFQAEDGIRDIGVTGVQTCALPIYVKAVAVMDKAEALSGNGGPVFNDVSSALYGNSEGKILMSYIYGLGGRDVTVNWLTTVFDDLYAAMKTGEYKKYNYLAVRG